MQAIKSEYDGLWRVWLDLASDRSLNDKRTPICVAVADTRDKAISQAAAAASKLSYTRFKASSRANKLAALSEAQNHRCCYCGAEMTLQVRNAPNSATFEHVSPLSKTSWPAGAWENLVAACYRCNNMRGDTCAFTFARQTAA